MPAFERPLGHQCEDLALARGQYVERVVDGSRSDELLNESRVHHRATTAHTVDRVEEFIEVRHPTLQHVTTPLSAREQRHGVLDLDVR
jgi:hypothetical protein